MMIIGVVGVVATVYSAVVLEDSVAALSELYTAGDETLRTLEKLDKSISTFRAQSLTHLASESATDMGSISAELKRLRHEIEVQLDELDAREGEPGGAFHHLRELIATYIGRIGEALALSADFEKEAAFEIVTDAENTYVPEIGGSIQRLIHDEFEQIGVSRRILTTAASHNLYTNIGLGIGGGGLLLTIAFIVTRRTTRRLSRLLDWSHRVSAGDLAAPLVGDSNDEVGRLTNAMGSMARNIARAHGELEASNKGLESFAYSVSHDLRGPLRAINGFAEVLREEYGECLDAAGHGYLQRMREASVRMSELIDGLLDLSRVMRSELKSAEVDLSALARGIANDLSATEPQRAVAWHIEPELLVTGDPVLLRAVLQNLLGNAWKFTAHREQAHITVGRQWREGRAVYHVRDNGVGFEMAYANKLFQPFERLHAGEGYEGTGIGLATVRRIVERHSGRVWAEGEQEKGVTISFTLGVAAP
jgi:signal transduction histidine kinase